jgi:D-aminoacyl-tRNA deacylase
MRAVVQRVRRARVRVGEETAGEIGPGFLVYVGVTRDDGPADVTYLVGKIAGLRVFDDDAGKMNRSLQDAGGRVLAVSQFTLYGDCRKGRRPSFDDAAPADVGRLLFDAVVLGLRDAGLVVETGVFQAHMLVDSENDGPVTMLLDSRKVF